MKNKPDLDQRISLVSTKSSPVSGEVFESVGKQAESDRANTVQVAYILCAFCWCEFKYSQYSSFAASPTCKGQNCYFPRYLHPCACYPFCRDFLRAAGIFRMASATNADPFKMPGRSIHRPRLTISYPRCVRATLMWYAIFKK